MTGALDHVSAWSHERVVAECAEAYDRYSHELDLHYARYFASQPDRAGHDRLVQAKFGSTERRRSRTDRAVGYTTALVLKTSWATGPMPLRAGG